MTPRAEHSGPGGEPAAFDAAPCAVEAYGVVRVPIEEIAALRKAPGPSLGTKISPSLLKHADHQTVLALAAVLRAAHEFGWSGRSFADWGVIAAPRFLGRLGASVTIYRFLQTGATSVSPLVIPTMSLHAVAGSLSLVLQSHGFNFGVGGGPGHLGEAVLAGLAARQESDTPGVWVVATGFDPEPVSDALGRNTTPSTGYAVALALTLANASGCRLNLRFSPTAATVAGRPEAETSDEDANGGAPLTPLISLAEFLAEPLANPRATRRWMLPLPGGSALVLDDDPARASGVLAPSARAG